MGHAQAQVCSRKLWDLEMVLQLMIPGALGSSKLDTCPHTHI